MKPGPRLGFNTSLLLMWVGTSLWSEAAPLPPLPGTARLTTEGDMASNLMAGVDRFLLGRINESVAGRSSFW